MKLIKTGWGLMISKVTFSVALIEMVKGGSKENEKFSEQWNKWFEREEKNQKSCLEVTRDKSKGDSEEGKDNYKYEKKECKWKLRKDKKKDAVSIFKKVFGDERSWAKKSFKKNEIDGLCSGGGSKWQKDKFGKNEDEVVEKVKNAFQETHCENGRNKYRGTRNGEHVNNWETSNNIKVIEGEVFEFGEKDNKELLAFEKEGDGKEVFEKTEETKSREGVTAGDWLKLARWGGSRADQSCHSVEQWETRNDEGANSETNQCSKSEDGEGGGKWLNDQNWENLKGWFGLGKESNCQWLMKGLFLE
ncbi:hypothetical protein [Mycoplasma suis]|uniref:Uncharacterized protein n=1 Tax=Mycoplasma suis (strain Illinois) TaxID=768700 RepID=F0QRV0_MYCSL|nr:hypothetical protein [Mycoplasma suis]ADX98220.1 hypothetical protein MSU_0689 [Mycoplasma suis str. Illinois]